MAPVARGPSVPGWPPGPMRCRRAGCPRGCPCLAVAQPAGRWAAIHPPSARRDVGRWSASGLGDRPSQWPGARRWASLRARQLTTVGLMDSPMSLDRLIRFRPRWPKWPVSPGQSGSAGTAPAICSAVPPTGGPGPHHRYSDGHSDRCFCALASCAVYSDVAPVCSDLARCVQRRPRRVQRQMHRAAPAHGQILHARISNRPLCARFAHTYSREVTSS
jgi:hypothetical protein